MDQRQRRSIESHWRRRLAMARPASSGWPTPRPTQEATTLLRIIASLEASSEDFSGAVDHLRPRGGGAMLLPKPGGAGVDGGSIGVVDLPALDAAEPL